MSQIFEKKTSLYPERFVDKVEKEIEVVEEFENGVRQPMDLNERERESVLHFENELGERFEGIMDITVQKMSFSASYFLTTEGREDFEKTLGISLSDMADEDDVVMHIFENRRSISSANYNEIKKLAARSRKHYDEQLFHDLIKSKDEDGHLDLSNIKTKKYTIFC